MRVVLWPKRKCETDPATVSAGPFLPSCFSGLMMLERGRPLYDPCDPLTMPVFVAKKMQRACEDFLSYNMKTYPTQVCKIK